MQLSVRLVAVLFAVAALLNGCANTDKLSEGRGEMAQTPVTENPSGETYQGKFIWHDLLSEDPLSAGKFYEQLFGWKIDYRGEYALVSNDDKLIAGILKMQPSDGPARRGIWIPTVSVADVDAAVSRVKTNGGTILKGPLDMDRRGRAALIRDPQRADLVLLNAKGGDPTDAEAGIGDWLWDEIWTSDPGSVEEFYVAVLKYDEVVSGDRYEILMNKGKWRAGIRHVQDGSKDNKHMLWVPVVRVADPEATARRVKELGGIVWVTPEDAPSKGDTALIADTSGTLLLIQRWPPQSSTEEI